MEDCSGEVTKLSVSDRRGGERAGTLSGYL